MGAGDSRARRDGLGEHEDDPSCMSDVLHLLQMLIILLHSTSLQPQLVAMRASRLGVPRWLTLFADIIGSANRNFHLAVILITFKTEEGAFGVAETDLAVALDEPKPTQSVSVGPACLTCTDAGRVLQRRTLGWRTQHRLRGSTDQSCYNLHPYTRVSRGQERRTVTVLPTSTSSAFRLQIGSSPLPSTIPFPSCLTLHLYPA